MSMVGEGPRPEILDLLVNLRRVLRNWYWLAPLSFVVLPSRCVPRPGLLNHPIAHRPVTLRLRNGQRLECLLSEFPGFVDAFVQLEYDVPGLRWPQVETVIDVGANVGAAAMWFCERAPRARVIAVEPGLAAFERCRRNIERNGLAGRVSVHRAALGGSTGRAYLHPGPATVTATVGSTREGAHDEEVRLLTLAALMEEHGIDFVDVLKLDCEGAEFDILLSADRRTLSRVGTIVGEYHGAGDNAPATLQQHLESAGFVTRFRRNVSQGLMIATRPDSPVMR